MLTCITLQSHQGDTIDHGRIMNTFNITLSSLILDTFMQWQNECSSISFIHSFALNVCSLFIRYYDTIDIHIYEGQESVDKEKRKSYI